MAIYRYAYSQYSNLSGFKDFLDSHKDDTFLKDFTIALSDSNRTLTISNDNSYVKIILRSSTATFDHIQFHGKYASLNGSNNAVYGTSYLMQAILCKNGLIFRLYGNDAAISNSFKTRFFALTTEEGGGLVLITGNPSSYTGSGSGVESGDNGYVVYSENASSTATIQLVSRKGAGLTSISPVLALAATDDIVLPYAYVAVYTQQASTEISAVTMGGASYITNGRWYIKDGE